MPDRIIKKSRPVGGKKRGRPPKNQLPVTETTSGATSSIPVTDTNSGIPLSALDSDKAPASITPSVVTSQAQPFTGLSQVNNTLTFTKFDPNSYFATDLFKDSSSLERTTKADADALVESIEEKRQTVRVAVANINLNQDVVRAGNEYLKLEGLAIDYATTRVNNETKFVNYQTAQTNQSIAVNRYEQTQERLIQGQKVLAGMRSITPLIDDEWRARKDNKQSQIKSLEIMAIQSKEALEPRILQLSQNFREELSDLN